jgi:hypothetical protein
MMDLGRVAYEAYVVSCDGKSVHGDPLPDWHRQHAVIRQHWRAAADAVLMYADLQIVRPGPGGAEVQPT